MPCSIFTENCKKNKTKVSCYSEGAVPVQGNAKSSRSGVTPASLFTA